MKHFLTIAAVSFVSIASLATTVQAGPWSVPSGSQPTFNYSSGSDLNNHFGTPLPVTNGFTFTPQLFVSQSTNDSTHNLADTTSVILNAAPNRHFSWISAGFLGDYQILGNGSASASGQVRVRNLDTMQVLVQALSFTPAMPQQAGLVVETSEGESDEMSFNGGFNSGLFESSGVIALPEGWSNIKIELDGLVSTYAQGASASLIQLKSGHINIGSEVIPLPAPPLAAIPAIGIAAWYRKRMRSKRA